MSKYINLNNLTLKNEAQIISNAEIHYIIYWNKKKVLILKIVSKTMSMASKLYEKISNYISLKESTNAASSTLFDN